jgi:dTDP-4-dehydrorhamnose 3,5-epimerase
MYMTVYVGGQRSEMEQQVEQKLEEPVFIGGGLSVDDRGVVMYCNDFFFRGIKRFYVLTNYKVGYVRAWHGHKKEAKFVTVTRGAAVVCCAPLYVFEQNDGTMAKVFRFVLSDKQPGVLYIPPGYANGHMALVEPTDVVHFSTMTMDEAIGDDVRFHANIISGIWKPKER